MATPPKRPTESTSASRLSWTGVALALGLSGCADKAPPPMWPQAPPPSMAEPIGVAPGGDGGDPTVAPAQPAEVQPSEDPVDSPPAEMPSEDPKPEEAQGEPEPPEAEPGSPSEPPADAKPDAAAAKKPAAAAQSADETEPES